MNHPGLIAGTRHIRWPIAVIVAAFMVIPNLASAQTQPDPPPVAALPPVAITSPAQAPAPYPVQRVVVGMRIVDMEDRGDPIPPGARRVTRRRAPFLIGGIGFLASWLITGTSMFAGVSCTFSGSGPAVCTPWLSAWVWVPVVGAFVGARR